MKEKIEQLYNLFGTKPTIKFQDIDKRTISDKYDYDDCFTDYNANTTILKAFVLNIMDSFYKKEDLIFDDLKLTADIGEYDFNISLKLDMSEYDQEPSDIFIDVNLIYSSISITVFSSVDDHFINHACSTFDAFLWLISKNVDILAYRELGDSHIQKVYFK